MENGYSKKIIKELAGTEDSIEGIFSRNVRFSITLTAYQNKRLEALTSKIGTSKAELIAKVIDAALLDLEDELGLINQTSVDLFGNTNVEYTTKYAREIVDAFGPEINAKLRDHMGLD